MSMPKSFLIQGSTCFEITFFWGHPRLISNGGLTNPDLTVFANLDVVRDLVLQGAGACHCRSNTKPFPSLLPSWERHRSRSAWSGTPPLRSGSRSTWSAFGWLRPRQKMTAPPCPSYRRSRGDGSWGGQHQEGHQASPTQRTAGSWFCSCKVALHNHNCCKSHTQTHFCFYKKPPVWIRALGGRQAAKGACCLAKAAKGAATRLKPGYCLTFLFEPMAKVRRWAVGKLQKAQEDRDAAYQKVAKGAGTRLEPHYCPTLLSEPSKKTSLKAPGRWPNYGAGRPASLKRRRRTGMLPTKRLQRSKARLLPNGAFWT